MSELSPAAQEIRDAVLATYADNIPHADVLWAIERPSIVAALLAGADQIAPVENEPIDDCWYEKENPVRDQLLVIATVAVALHAAADHIRTIGPWVGHTDSPGLDWAVLEIASIATELENHG